MKHILTGMKPFEDRKKEKNDNILFCI